MVRRSSSLHFPCSPSLRPGPRRRRIRPHPKMRALPRRTCRSSRGRSRSSVKGASTTPPEHAAAGGRSFANTERAARDPLRRRQHTSSRPGQHPRPSVGRARSADRRAAPSLDPGASRDISYRIDTATGWAQIDEAGEYRATPSCADRARTRGAARSRRADQRGGRTPLRAGERAFARRERGPVLRLRLQFGVVGRFDRWSGSRRSERLGVSTQYLPEEVRPYSASFDRYGSWRYESSYGYVWYPRVEVGWRPVLPRPLDDVCAPTARPGSRSDPWGWPTHHYGRWGFNAAAPGSGFPGAPGDSAWVSWAHAPGYVSWCPLGWNNRPVVQFVNAHNYYGG